MLKPAFRLPSKQHTRPFSASRKFFHLKSLEAEATAVNSSDEFDTLFNEVSLGFRAGLRFDNAAASIIARVCRRFGTSSQAQSFLAMGLASRVTNLQELAECAAACAMCVSDVHHALVATHAAGDMQVGTLPEALPETARLALLAHNHVATRAIAEAALHAYPPSTRRAQQLSQRLGEQVLDILISHTKSQCAASGTPQQADVLWLGAPLRALAAACTRATPQQQGPSSAAAGPTELPQSLPPPAADSGTDGFLADLLAGIKPSSHTRPGRTLRTATPSELIEEPPAPAPVEPPPHPPLLCCMAGGVSQDPSIHHATALSVVCSMCALERTGMLPKDRLRQEPPAVALGVDECVAHAASIQHLARIQTGLASGVVPVSLQVSALAALSLNTPSFEGPPPEALKAAVTAAQAAASRKTPLTNEACALLLAGLVRHRGAALALRLLTSQALLRAEYIAQGEFGTISQAAQEEAEAMQAAYDKAQSGAGLPPMPQGRQRGAICAWELRPLLCPAGLPSSASVVQLAAVLGRCDTQMQAYAPSMDLSAVQVAMSLFGGVYLGQIASLDRLAAKLQEAAVKACCIVVPQTLDATGFVQALDSAVFEFQCALQRAVQWIEAGSEGQEALQGIVDVCCELLLQRFAGKHSVHRHEWHAAAKIAASALQLGSGLPRAAAATTQVLSALQRDVLHPDEVAASISLVMEAAIPSILARSQSWAGAQPSAPPQESSPPETTLLARVHTEVQDAPNAAHMAEAGELQRSLALLAGAMASCSLPTAERGASSSPSTAMIYSALHGLVIAHMRVPFPQNLSKTLTALVSRFITSALHGSGQEADELLKLCDEAGLQLPTTALLANIRHTACRPSADDALQAATAFAAALPHLSTASRHDRRLSLSAAASVIQALLSAAETASERTLPGPFDDSHVELPQAMVHDAWLAVSLPFHQYTLPRGRKAWWSSRALNTHPGLSTMANRAASVASTPQEEWKAESQTSPFEHAVSVQASSHMGDVSWPPHGVAASDLKPTDFIACAIDVLLAASTVAVVDVSVPGEDPLSASEVASAEDWLLAQLQLLGKLRHIDGIMHTMTTRHVFGVPASQRFCESLSAAIIRRPPNSATSSRELPLSIVQSQGIKWDQAWSDEAANTSGAGAVSRGQAWARCVLAVIDCLDAEQPNWPQATYRHFLAFAAHRRYAGLSSRLLQRQRAQADRSKQRLL